MSLVAGTVPGGPGRPQLMCVGAPGGLSVHLFNPVDKTVLCNGLRVGRIVVDGTRPYTTLGCRRCTVEAIKRGYDRVIDVACPSTAWASSTVSTIGSTWSASASSSVWAAVLPGGATSTSG